MTCGWTTSSLVLVIVLLIVIRIRIMSMSTIIAVLVPWSRDFSRAKPTNQRG
jgi:hypothetical protein